MARHHLFNEAYANPVRPRSQMSGDQRKRSASKKSARAMAKSHRRQADASYDAMLEAQDDAWEGGEYQGRYAYENPFYVTPGGQAVGVHSPSRWDAERMEAHGTPSSRRRFNEERHKEVAHGATALEREGHRFHIKKVGDEYRIFDAGGNYMMKFAYSLDKAQAILERLVDVRP